MSTQSVFIFLFQFFLKQLKDMHMLTVPKFQMQGGLNKKNDKVKVAGSSNGEHF